MRYYLDSIGCRLNQAEMEALARRLLAAGHAIVDRPEAAERVLLNTCAVTAEAAREARKRSRRFHRLSPGAEIVLTGCYATLEPEALATLPGVGRVVANARKEDLIALLDPAAAEDPPAYELEPAMRLQRGAGGGHTRAFVKVQDGCDKRCSFCVTTLARGAGRSRPLEAVVDEVEALSRAGYREAVLTGVHLGSYGQDLGRRAGLSELIAALLARTAIPRLRLSSLEPWDIPDGFFALWEDRRLLPHLHLPLQAGCDRTLARMARGVSTAEFRALAARARAAIPDLNLTTDLIAGFPGETEADFEAGLNFVREIGFGHLHVFPYSERPGTAAARMPGRVPVPERKDRARRLIALGETLAAATHARFLGREAEVLWERGDRAPGAGRRQRWTGYTEGYLPVSLDSRQALANQISRVRLVAATAEGLRGRLSSPRGSRFPARDRCRG
ncbi:MAG: tRNA (N(6)-L-threonylcarbamoyladenosine(37)-C(2))-methylthiotransferase MtaB [Chloroflexi bacterium]|nr:tRNA (N(6)-L-threonylcarbamoyladenosine(37)-C(2))-methylthiotransferase MtaB [Chloroflexota bacterium]